MTLNRRTKTEEHKVTCKACTDRGKTWSGADPKCAFEGHTYSLDNWNCATMWLLRKIVASEEDGYGSISGVSYQFCEDQKYATIACDEVEGLDGALCLWMSWYKRRGATDRMFLMHYNGLPTVPSEAECLAIIDAYKFRATA